MAILKTYSPKGVNIAWGGIALTGLGEDTMITVSRNADNSSTTVGSQGDVQHVKIADQTGMVELTLLQNSESNLYLTNIQFIQDNSSDLIFKNLTITDPSGGMLWDARGAHLRKAADCVLGSGHNAKTYSFHVNELVSVGANSSIAEALGVVARVNAAAGVINSLVG